MKKRLICTLLLISIILSLCACSGEKKEDGRITVLCTLFPQYDWLRNLTRGSENINLSLIIANGTDPHSYQPTAEDIMSISNCDMIVYVGGDSDEWVETAIERSKNKNTDKVVLTKLSGMSLQNISASSHSHEEHSDTEHSHEGHSHSTLDEHLYLSLRNAVTAIKALTERLCLLDESNSELYLKNSREYIAKLSSLDADFAATLDTANIDTPFMLFADRFPFVYLLADYDIHYAAAFEGCTTDVNADFDTVIRLINEADEHNVKYIAVTENSDKALANTVISSTKSKEQKIILLNSMQAVSRSQINGGADYLSIMEENISAIKTAIGITN